jgi:hypothetical protein
LQCNIPYRLLENIILTIKIDSYSFEVVVILRVRFLSVSIIGTHELDVNLIRFNRSVFTAITDSHDILADLSCFGHIRVVTPF